MNNNSMSYKFYKFINHMDITKKIDIPDYLKFCTKTYKILEIVGEGTFSTVYKAIRMDDGYLVALKCITKTSAPSRILDELMIIKKLQGENNCIKLLDVLRNEDQIVAVFPFICATDFKWFLLSRTMLDIKKYMYNLLTAVAHVHDNYIIHRDLKPSNFMYNQETGIGYLIDFGLAQYENKKECETKNKDTAPVLFFNSIVVPSKLPGYYDKDRRPQMKAPRAGTRGFRAPEVLFRYQNQTCSIDMWSVGVIFICLLTAQYPFFYSNDDIDNLVEIALIFGHFQMRKIAKVYGRLWKSNLPTIKEEKINFKDLIKSLNPGCEIDNIAIDLLESLLDLNCNTRITAEKALEHMFFDELKKNQPY